MGGSKNNIIVVPGYGEREKCLIQFHSIAPGTRASQKTTMEISSTMNGLLTLVTWIVTVANLLAATVTGVVYVTTLIAKKGNMDHREELNYRSAITMHLAWSIMMYLLIM